MAFVVVDLDGCLIDDVNKAFGKLLRKEDSAVEHVFKELIFTVMDHMPKVVDSIARSIDFEKDINMDTVRALKKLYDLGMEIVVRTANRELGEDGVIKIKRILGENGIVADVELTGDKGKYAMRNGEKPALLLDDKPNVIANAAKRGIRSILIKTDYNRIEGLFTSSVNKLVSISDSKEIGNECMRAIKQREVSF